MARIDLNRRFNPLCIKKCNRNERTKEAEYDLCSRVKSVEDKLPVRCVGNWAEKKIYLLYQYFGIFAVGMKKKWPLNYIEICSGPGKCINRQDGYEFDGTAISILKHKQFQIVNRAFYYDYNNKVIEILSQRIANLNLSHKASAKVGDYNNPDTIINDLLQLGSKSLNLILIDPTDCSVPFSLIKKIKDTLNHVDLIINVATMTDFNRNIPMAFDDEERADKYIRFLGNDEFFTLIENRKLYKNRNYQKLRERFRKTYEESLKRIGYSFFDYTPINGYYDILFSTSNKKGLEFWKKATKVIDSTGQRSFDFEL